MVCVKRTAAFGTRTTYLCGTRLDMYSRCPHEAGDANAGGWTRDVEAEGTNQLVMTPKDLIFRYSQQRVSDYDSIRILKAQA